MRYIILTTALVKVNWDHIKNDPYNNRPDIETPQEYIKEAKEGKVTCGGARVIVQDNLAA